MSAPLTAGRHTGLTSVAHLDLPRELAQEWARGLVQAANHPEPALGHNNWRRWSDVDLDVFLLTLCGGEVAA